MKYPCLITKKISELQPAKYNPRKISSDALGRLTKSLSELGNLQPITWNAKTGNIVGGHQRLKCYSALQKEEVDKLQAVQDKLAKELAVAQKKRLTLEQQRQIALLEEANAGIAAITPDQSKIWPDIGFTGRSSTRSNEVMRAQAIEFAKKQVLAKKPYVWGDEGPNAFDCSGLVYAAYRAAGLGWPNWDRLNSALYSTYTMHVGLDELVPGDLLFYSYKGTISTIHHITIYAGGGKMWEANSKGKGLLYSDVHSIKGLMPFGGRV